ncbi:MAG: acetoacetate decarboxylase [Deltaproteobacteria bacterium]|nr:acetoacetate decarboxylase [Deltaproteobacteria bacterium]
MDMEYRTEENVLVDPEDASIRVPARPAPWTLTGRGFMVLYKFSREFLRHQAFLPPDEGITPAGGLGALMIIDYTASDAGPYSELLFIPGKVHAGGGRWHRITKIYVSTMVSVLNGRRNWGIPKEPARFHFSRRDNLERIEVVSDAGTFFQTEIKIAGPHFPVSTKLLPFPLMQGKPGAWLQTTFSGRGWGRLAFIRSIESHQQYFPDLAGTKPLVAISIDPFHITFPPAKKIGAP